MDQHFDELIKPVLNNHTSGSTALTHELTKILSTYLEEVSADHIKGQVVKEELDAGLYEIFMANKNMISIIHFINEFYNTWHQKETTFKAFQDQLISIQLWLRQYRDYWNNAPEYCAAYFSEAVPALKKVLVHSHSGSIMALAGYWSRQKKHVKFIQTESRPLKEGQYQASSLSELNFKVHYIVDCAISQVMSEIDAVILGCDHITNNHFCNKTGSYPIALMANHFNIPVYVLTDSRKILGEVGGQWIFEENKKPNSEIWKHHDHDIQITNTYFEKVPLALCSGIATEQGFFNPKDIQNHSAFLHLSDECSRWMKM